MNKSAEERGQNKVHATLIEKKKVNVTLFSFLDIIYRSFCSLELICLLSVV